MGRQTIGTALADLVAANPEGQNVKEEGKSPKKEKRTGYWSLFRYSTCSERFFIFLGLLMSVICGFGLPLVNVIYGEFTNLMVDRQFPTHMPSSDTYIIKVFGGGRILQGASDEENRKALHEDAVAFALACVTLSSLLLVAGVVSVFLLNWVALRQVTRIRELFFRSVLCKDMAWFDTEGAKSFTSRITEDLGYVEQGIGERLAIFTFQFVMVFVILTLCFFSGWMLSLVLCACMSPLVLNLIINSRLQSKLTTQELHSYGHAGTLAEEVFSGIRTVVAFSGEEIEVSRYAQRLAPSQKMGIKRSFISALGGGILWLVNYCCYAVAFAYGVRLILDSRENQNTDYTPAVLIIVFFGVVTGATNLGYAVAHLEAFAVARGAGAAILKVINTKPLIDPLSPYGKTLSGLRGDIEFKNVQFHYPARQRAKILRNLNLNIKAGQMVAIVGGSGSGKSTVLQLLQRLYDPVAGDVYVDGENLKSLNVAWYRKNLGVVGQEPLLFATTIRENIQYGDATATDEDIIIAAKKANAHDFIMRLQFGYETVIGQKGSTLSGGQKQRIAIARALIRNPSILLLDEATSALDATSEKVVQAALDNAAIGRTTLVVTHRLSTISNVDRIIVVGDGIVKEDGTHQELIKLNGIYSELLKSQSEVAQAGSGTQPVAKVEFIPPSMSVQQVFDDVLVPGPRARNSLFHNKSLTNIYRRDVIKEDRDVAPISLKRLFSWNKPEWVFLLVGSLAAIVAGTALPAVCVLFGDLYGFLSLTDHKVILDKTDLYSIILIVIGILAGFGVFLQIYCLAIAGIRMTTRLRIEAFRSIVYQEIGWFDREENKVGALCARLSQDAAGVQGATGSRIGLILQSLSTMTLAVILSFTYTWKMTLVTLATVPFVFLGVYMESLLLGGQNEKEKQALESATNVAVEAITNIKVVASLGKETLFMANYSEALREGEERLTIKALLRGVAFGVGQTAPFFGYALSLWYGGTLVADEDLHYRNVVKVSELLIFGAWMLGQSIVFAPSFSAAKASASRLQYLFQRTPHVTDGEISVPPVWDEKSTIRYSKVGFAYPTRPDTTILRGLDLEIKKGQSVALVGQSGCGKSTVIQLLQRLYDPQSGMIYISKQDITTFRLSVLRSLLGLVGQEPVLFDRTIRENIAYGDNTRKISMTEIVAAAEASNIHNFIISLPLGYDTRLGSSSTQLSGGQKQRIAIARALVRNPKILLLDEATSALDPQSEKIVQETLDKAAAGRTTITIAHRLGAVVKADIIYVLEKGRVIESGTHAKLMALQGKYYEMHSGTVTKAPAEVSEPGPGPAPGPKPKPKPKPEEPSGKAKKK